MIITVIVALTVIAVLGLLTMFGLNILSQRGIVSNRLRISAVEFLVAFLVAGLVVTPATWEIGKKLSVDAVLIDKEFYDGVEKQPQIQVKQCHAGQKPSMLSTLLGTNTSSDADRAENSAKSNCSLAYVSDTVSFPYEVCSGTGKHRTCTDYNRIISVYTPYATSELTYSVSDTLGQTYHYPGAYIPVDAQPYSGHSIPGSIPRGAPADWQDAMAHWQAGNPRPTTAEFTYKNPILALQRRAGLDYYDNPPPADVVQGYVSKRLIPDHTVGILKNPIQGASGGKAQTVADKAGFVCTNMSAADQQAWQDKLMQFNAQLGMNLQGDLHLLIVGGCISDLHEYTRAVKAYWQGPHFGNSPLSKNGIVVVLQTTDGKTIAGADATTGMPFGNNGMLNSIRTFLPGTALSPRDVLGDPHTFVSDDGKTKRYTQGSPAGSLESIMLTGQYKFYRICMISCPAGQTGYGDLIAQLEPTTTAKIWMVVIIGIISLIFWLIMAKTEFLDTLWETRFGRRPRHRPQYEDDYSYTSRTYRF